MTDSTTTIEHLKKIFKTFCEERNWDKLRSPKDLSMDIVSEATELMDLFVFVEENQLLERMDKKKEAVEHEIADIAFALLNFCTTFNIDLSNAIEQKMKLNAQKHTMKQNKDI